MMTRKRWTIAFWVWCAVILTLTSMPTTPWVGPDVLQWDKLAHAFVYAVFGVLYLQMRMYKGIGAVRELLVIMPFVPLLDEAHQLFIPGRNFSLLDWAADMTGILLAIAAMHFIRKYRKRKLQTS